MMLWVASWNADDALRRRTTAALSSMDATFPSLQQGPATSSSWEGPSHISLVRGPEDGGAKADLGPEVCSIVDGFAIVDGARILRPVDLSASPGPEPDRLDGQFGIVRATPSSLTVTTDFLGVRGLYWCRAGRTTLVANDVEVLARITGATALDPEGVAHFASMGWVLGRRTLCAGVERVPDGVRWSWNGAGPEPDRRTYFRRSTLAGRRSPLDARRLAGDLQSRLRAIDETVDTMRCPLSGGLDSRVIMALLRSAGIDAEYFTQGNPDSGDVVAAEQLAAMLGLRHQVAVQSPNDVSEQWEAVSKQIVEQNDGMVSLWQSADAVRTDRLRDSGSAIMYGLGGGAGRGRLTTWRSLTWRKHGEAAEWLQRRPSSGGGLLTPRCAASARAHLGAFVARTADEGFSPPEVPDAFYLFERETGYGAANARKVGYLGPVFVPYFTRPFIESAFSLSPAKRFSEPIHFELLGLLDRRLQDFGVERGYWHSQAPYLNLVRHRWHRKARMMVGLEGRRPKARVGLLDQAAWIETMRASLRERYLDERASDLWEFVDRSAFEAVMAEGAGDRRRLLGGTLLDVFTLFDYERFRSGAPRLDVASEPAPGG